MKKIIFLSLLVALGVAFITESAAQVGNDNLTGTSGIFNGNVNTGCSYDPYTGNATRGVTDINVAGAVGANPLSFTRVMNSRYTVGVGTLQFGAAGTWRHNYQWDVTCPPIATSAGNKYTIMPSTYYVNYPDGRRVSFFTASPYYKGLGGIADRFQQLTDPNAAGQDCYVLLPDGSRIWFQGYIDREENEITHVVTSTFTFVFMGIIDPYQQTISVSYTSDGSMTLTEPAGRMLKIFYSTINSTANGAVGDVVVDHVVEFSQVPGRISQPV